MTIHVFVFGALAARVGQRELFIDLGHPATVSDALDALCASHPQLADFRATLAIAVNQAYVQADHVLAEGDELALIPPVSGG